MAFDILKKIPVPAGLKQKIAPQIPHSMKQLKDFDSIMSKHVGIPTTKVGAIEPNKTQASGTVYGQKFMMNFPNKAVLIRLNSKQKTFDTIHSVDVFDAHLQWTTRIHTTDKFPIMPFCKSVAIIGKKLPFKNLVGGGPSIQQEGGGLLNSDIAAVQITEAIVSIVVGILTLILVARVIFRVIRSSMEEREAKYKIEEELNKFLFSGQTGKESAFSIYSDLINGITAVIQNRSNGVLIYGRPGMSKTYIVRRTLYFNNVSPQQYMFVKGSALSEAAFYKVLYDAKDGKILILDDFDEPLKNAGMINLLKAALDSYPIRIISLPTEYKASSKALEVRLPDKFKFAGRIIMITNLTAKDIDTAIASRVPCIEVDFDTKQVLNAVNKMLQYIAPHVDMKIKQEVLEYVTQVCARYPQVQLDFRKFQSCIDARLGNPQRWKELVLVILGVKSLS